MRPSSSLFALLRRASPSTRAGLVALVVLGLGSRFAVIVTAVAIGEGVSRAAVVAGVVTTVLLGVQRLVQILTRARFERDIHRATVEALLETDVVDIARERTQRVVFEGSFHAVPLVSSLLPALLSDAIAALVVVPLLLTTFPERLLGIAAPAMLVVGGAVLVARRLAQRSEAALNAAYEEVADALLVAVEGRLEIVASGRERAFEERFDALTARYVERAHRVGLVSAWLGRAPLVVGALSIGALALVDAASRQELGAALFGRALVLAACLPPLFGAVVGVQAFARNLALAGPLAQLLAWVRRDEPVAASAPTLPATFEVDRVSFRYADGQPQVFSGVSFEWTVEQPIVLVGENGSGKSTLMRLLVGLRRPSSGAIRVGGQDLSTIDLRALRQQIAYLPQRPYLGEPHHSLRAAIHIAVPDASDAQIEAALAKVGLLAAVRAHGGLDVTVGTLSAGQRQRAALARVLLQDRAKAVFLDEPDANLDVEGIALVASLVRALAREGKMVLVVAHTAELVAVSEHRIDLGSG